MSYFQNIVIIRGCPSEVAQVWPMFMNPECQDLIMVLQPCKMRREVRCQFNTDDDPPTDLLMSMTKKLPLLNVEHLYLDEGEGIWGRSFFCNGDERPDLKLGMDMDVFAKTFGFKLAHLHS